MVSCVGGLIGVGLSELVFAVLAAQFEWQMAMAPEAIAVSFAFATLIAVAFRSCPAMRAARLRPDRGGQLP